MCKLREYTRLCVAMVTFHGEGKFTVTVNLPVQFALVGTLALSSKREQSGDNVRNRKKRDTLLVTVFDLLFLNYLNSEMFWANKTRFRCWSVENIYLNTLKNYFKKYSEIQKAQNLLLLLNLLQKICQNVHEVDIKHFDSLYAQFGYNSKVTSPYNVVWKICF